jgi:hypothetical protein
MYLRSYHTIATTFSKTILNKSYARDLIRKESSFIFICVLERFRNVSQVADSGQVFRRTKCHPQTTQLVQMPVDVPKDFHRAFQFDQSGFYR